MDTAKSGDKATVPTGGTGDEPRKKKKSSNKQKQKKAKKVEREKLKDGDAIKSENFSWKVTKLLGSGGFGDVYKVHKDTSSPDKKEYAMKTEMVEGNTQMLRLKIEVTVLKQCWESDNPEIKKHFVEFVDRGITPKFKFLVMGLVGPSLKDIRGKYLLKNFSKPTALNSAIQTLEAITALHNVGWLHRDIKPQNFAVGIAEKEDTIYILDFGIAKTIFKPDSKEVKPPRQKVKFLGTVRFASRACHAGFEQGRKDDLETWLYMVFNLFDNDHGLSWKRACDKIEVLKLKELFFRQKPEKQRCYKNIPKDFYKIAEHINSLGYASEPDYKFINEMLVYIGQENNISLDKKPDWMGKLKKKKSSEQKDEDTSSDNRQSGSE